MMIAPAQGSKRRPLRCPEQFPERVASWAGQPIRRTDPGQLRFEGRMGAASILVVVWLGLGSGVTYQVPFSSPALCEAARKAVLDDAGRTRSNLPAGTQAMTSAICLSVTGMNR